MFYLNLEAKQNSSDLNYIFWKFVMEVISFQLSTYNLASLFFPTVAVASQLLSGHSTNKISLYGIYISYVISL